MMQWRDIPPSATFVTNPDPVTLTWGGPKDGVRSLRIGDAITPRFRRTRADPSPAVWAAAVLSPDGCGNCGWWVETA